ncbi:CHASE2 domain-containing protein [Vibrio parahaemolyticus]|uniref:CHASE2 domain-containing protein n=2 Tax=Vibrio parahaemolyticus TaxID=670 RepID=UPI00235DC8BF|nr:CHASE2 domain-containing protein [Vibrio parahaemolyticus]
MLTSELKHMLRKCWVMFCSMFQALVVSFVILFNPLGLKNTSQEQSELVYLDFTASSFDASIESAVVVLIDEYAIEKYKLSYPVDYGNLSRVLRAISGYNPDAVFIDILQSYQHSKGLDYWVRTLKKTSNNHPVYLAQDLDFDKEWRLNNKENIRYKLNQGATLTPVSWGGAHNRYPLTINHGGHTYKTTAMTMYEEFCKTSDCQLFKNSDAHDEPMVVRWSNNNNDKQLEFMGVADGCESSNRGLLEAIKKHVTYGFKKKEDIAELRVMCPPILTLSAAEFLDAGGADNQALRDVISNRSVFIGYNLTGSSDLFSSPVHGQLPGVFYHAMAFVNLVSLDNNYWRSQNAIEYCPIIESCNFSYFDLIQTLLQTIVLGFSIYLKNSQELNGREERTLSIGSTISFILLLIIVFVFVLLFQFSVGPANWIALLSILFISSSILAKPFLIKYFQRIIKFVASKLTHLKHIITSQLLLKRK